MAATTRSYVLTCPQCGAERVVKAKPDPRKRRWCYSCSNSDGRGVRRKEFPWTGTRLHRIWSTMKIRCGAIAAKHHTQRYYADRGITLCAEWLSFEAFRDWSMANGYADDLEIDRENNDLGYSPDNCRWVTRLVNRRNTRRNVFIEAFGHRRCIAEWAEITGLSTSLIAKRRQSGLSPEHILAPVKGTCRAASP